MRLQHLTQRKCCRSIRNSWSAVALVRRTARSRGSGSCGPRLRRTEQPHQLSAHIEEPPRAARGVPGE